MRDYDDDEPNEEDLYMNNSENAAIAAEETKVTVTMDLKGNDDLLSKIAYRICNHPDFDMKGVREKVSAAVDKVIAEVIDGAMRAHIGARVDELLAKAIDKPYQLTNTYGEPTGKTVTIREKIEDMTKRVLTERVDENGRASTYSGEKFTRVEHIIKKHGIEPALAGAKAEVDKIATEAKKQVAAAVGNFIAQNLATPAIAHASARIAKG